MIKLQTLFREYPRQYWLMIAGVVVSTAGGSMIWPFMLIYASGKLDMPLSAVAMLISINAGMGLIASLVAGFLADKIGRKIIMILSLALNGIAYFFMMSAETYSQFAALMVLIGLSNPLYQVGADAMLADMIPSEKRTDAYAINRIANNAAFGIGPAVGGFLAGRDYNLAFIGAGAGFVIYSLMLFFLAHETLGTASDLEETTQPTGQTSFKQGFITDILRMARDKAYLAFVGLVAIGLTAPIMLWILMPIYAKTNFGIPESQYGWIPTTNALMCVFVQYSVTSITRRYKTLPVLAVGMFIYALGVGSVAFMSSFWGFWLSMVILTFGELTIAPTASQYVADIAPADMRGRYMSLYWFGWGLARTLAPLIGGFLNDNLFPRAIWIGGITIGLVSTVGLVLLNNLVKSQAALRTQP
jgi:MFS family permease